MLSELGNHVLTSAGGKLRAAGAGQLKHCVRIGTVLGIHGQETAEFRRKAFTNSAYVGGNGGAAVSQRFEEDFGQALVP